MRRLLTTLHSDIRLQIRNGFYWAAAIVAVCWIILLRQLLIDEWYRFLPVLFLSNLLVGTFYFVAGLVLLEKREGTLTAQVVTPLRDWEYLAAKTVSLTGLAIVESYAILALSGIDLHPIPLLLGVAAGAVILTLTGFISVSRFSSVNEYLFPSFLITMLFVPPFLNYFGILKSSLHLLHPLAPPLTLASLALEAGGRFDWLYGLTGSLLWCGLLFVAALRAYRRFVVADEGGSP